MRRFRILVSLGVLIAVSLLYPGFVRAAQDQAVGGPAGVDLDFQINIPTILWLRVGSPGLTVDTITFDIDDVPGSGPVLGTSTGAFPVPVEVRGFVGSGVTMTLSADSSTELNDGGGNNIPFSEVYWTASGAFSPGRFSDIAAQQLDQFTDSGERLGTYTFYYDNDTYYPAGAYTGTVTFTLSSP